MERATCPITGSRDVSAWLDVPDRFDPSGKPWRVVRSNASGLLMLDPRPAEAEMGTHYRQLAYDPFLHRSNARSLRDHAYLALSALLLDLRAAIVMRQPSPRPACRRRILEVGCSTGRLLARLRRNYAIPADNLFGVEPDLNAADAARSSGLANIRTTALHETAYRESFDRIIFWHTLEHIHRISETLDAAHRLLDEQGMLVIALPNAGGRDARHYGPAWIAYDAPRHLYHFTPETLAMLLDKHGFRVMHVQSYAPDALYNAWYSERLQQSVSGHRFGLPQASAALLQAACSVMAGRNPKHASGFVCHALRS